MSDGSEMLYSSGTTGRPKAVRRPLPSDGNGSWAQSVLEMALTHKYGMSPSSVYLSPAPLYHAAGVNYTMAVNRVGAASIIMAKIRRRDRPAADRDSPRHPRPVRADDVRADAQAAQGRPAKNTTCRVCGA